jgi:hypothetical protein
LGGEQKCAYKKSILKNTILGQGKWENLFSPISSMNADILLF